MNIIYPFYTTILYFSINIGKNFFEKVIENFFLYNLLQILNKVNNTNK
jgi:hypothetical protein